MGGWLIIKPSGGLVFFWEAEQTSNQFLFGSNFKEFSNRSI